MLPCGSAEKIEELTEEQINDLINRLLYHPSFITAFEKIMIGNYLQQQLIGGE